MQNLEFDLSVTLESPRKTRYVKSLESRISSLHVITIARSVQRLIYRGKPYTTKGGNKGISRGMVNSLDEKIN